MLKWNGMVWYGVVWCGVVWYGMVWYGMVYYIQFNVPLVAVRQSVETIQCILMSAAFSLFCAVCCF